MVYTKFLLQMKNVDGYLVSRKLMLVIQWMKDREY